MRKTLLIYITTALLVLCCLECFAQTRTIIVNGRRAVIVQPYAPRAEVIPIRPYGLNLEYVPVRPRSTVAPPRSVVPGPGPLEFVNPHYVEQPVKSGLIADITLYFVRLYWKLEN